MILYAQTNKNEPVMGTDRWKVVHSVELPRDQFIHFQNHMFYDRTFIEEHSSELYVDMDGNIRGLLVLCEGSEDGILVNSEGSNYARYSAYLPGARSLLLLDSHPALKDFCQQMSAMVGKCTQYVLDSHTEGEAALGYLGIDLNAPPEGFSIPLFLKMLSERPEIESAEATLDGFRVTVAEPYLKNSGPEQSM